MSDTKKFDGKNYKFTAVGVRKGDVKGVAQSHKNAGRSTRIVKEGKLWVLYVRK